MKKINVDNFRCEFKRDNYLFILTIKDNIVTIKRINNLNSYFREKIIVDLDNFNIDISTSPKTIMTYTKIDELLEILNNILKTHYILFDIINVDELFKLIKLNYKKHIYINDQIGLTNHFYNSEENNVFIYDIVLLENNEIIGNIRCNNSIDDFSISLKNEYSSYKDYIKNLFKTKILLLKNNS